MRTIFTFQRPLHKELLKVHFDIRSQKLSQSKKTETFTGDTIPSNVTGKNGDVFVKTDSQEIYVKEGGKWD